MGHRFLSLVFVAVTPTKRWKCFRYSDGGWMEDWQKVPQVIGPFVPHHLEYPLEQECCC